MWPTPQGFEGLSNQVATATPSANRVTAMPPPLSITHQQMSNKHVIAFTFPLLRKLPPLLPLLLSE